MSGRFAYYEVLDDGVKTVGSEDFVESVVTREDVELVINRVE